jgi:hypothetical protein
MATNCKRVADMSAPNGPPNFLRPKVAAPTTSSITTNHQPRTHSGARRNYNSSRPVQNLAQSVNSGPSLDLSDSDAKFSSGPDPALIDLTSRPPVTVEFSTVNWRARAHFERDRHTRTPQVLSYPYSSISHCDAKNKESAELAPFNDNEEFTVFTFSDSDEGTAVMPVPEWDRREQNQNVERRGKNGNLERWLETGSMIRVVGATGRSEDLERGDSGCKTFPGTLHGL